jgi:hypothetical protein
MRAWGARQSKEHAMTKLEHYKAKAAESLAAAEAAGSASERDFHRRAHAIWRRLMAGISNPDERAAPAAPSGARSR